MSARQAPDRNIAMELVRVTEAGAMAAARWIGRGDKEAADKAAVDAMRYVLDSVAMRGVVVIGEGEKDEAPMLYNGEEVGSGEGPEVDVAVDPLEGTRLTALGQPNAITVIAVAERGTMLFPGAALYMEKIAVGPAAIDAIDITRSPTENVVAVAEALGKTAREVDVVVLERERHEELIAELSNDYTIVIVTHNMQQASRVSDYTAFMFLGELVEFDTTEKVFTTPSKTQTEDYITGRFG